MSQKLNRKDKKALNDALGKQRISLQEFELAQNSSDNAPESGILNICSFSFRKEACESEKNTSDGWYVGYDTKYNGVGISKSQDVDVSSESEEENEENVHVCETNGESSGFSSDPPTDEEVKRKKSSDEGSDDGQLLYGFVTKSSPKSSFFISKGFTSNAVKLHHGEDIIEFPPAEVTETKRLQNCSQNFEKQAEHVKNEYQIIGDNPQINSYSEDEESNNEASSSSENVFHSHSSGLWNNFVINIPNASLSNKCSVETSDSITLDEEKISQISAAMANFTLPTPPGWENVDDSQILEFVKSKIV